jgi:STE24 endopeptidase
MWKEVFVGIILLSYVLKTYLSYRQLRTVKKATAPPEIYKEMFTEEEFQVAKNKDLDSLHFGFIVGVYGLAQSICEVIFIAKLWEITAFYQNETIHSIIFMIVSAIIDMILDIPVSYYSNFVIEEKYGFNRLTIKLWITDMLKALFIEIVLVSILIPLLIFIYNKSGPKFVFIAMIFIVSFSLILNIIAPILIIPLFTKLTPITEGPVADAVRDLCEKSNYNVKEIYEADDSKRSSHTNAQVFGLCPKKISIADTMIKQSTPEKIAAVIGHEIGHSKHHHIILQFLLGLPSSIVMLIAIYYIMSYDEVFKDLGFTDKPFFIGVFIVSILLNPFNTIISLPLNLLSRRMERQADEFSANLGLPLDEALMDLAKDNKVAIEPEPLFAAFSSSHPSISERIKYIRTVLQKHAKKE